MVVGDLPHMGQFFGEGLHGVEVQAQLRQDIIAPDLLGLQLPVRGAPIGGVAVPAAGKSLDGGRDVQGQGVAVGRQDAEDALGGGRFAGLVDADVLQGPAHVKQYGINHNSHCLFQGRAGSSAGGLFFQYR